MVAFMATTLFAGLRVYKVNNHCAGGLLLENVEALSDREGIYNYFGKDRTVTPGFYLTEVKEGITLPDGVYVGMYLPSYMASYFQGNGNYQVTWGYGYSETCYLFSGCYTKCVERPLSFCGSYNIPVSGFDRGCY